MKTNKDNFNIFKVLEKDDKELIHSSFIKFLIEEDKLFASEFIGYSVDSNFDISIEKAYTYELSNRKKKKHCRFDIEIKNSDTIIVVENKFKSFPQNKQLREYDEALSTIYSNYHQIKILLCFEKTLIKNIDNWKVTDYGELLPLIQKASDRLPSGDKKILVNHYLDFLNEYYVEYKQLDSSFVNYFLNQRDKESKFWIKLIYSSLALKFENHFRDKSIDVEIVANPGNTSIPVLNIIPKHWKIEGNPLLIQIQDGIFKFYAHSGDKVFLSKIREFSMERINMAIAKIKKSTNRISNSECIFSININEYLRENSTLNQQELYDFTLKFYEIIEERIIKNYCKQ